MKNILVQSLAFASVLGCFSPALAKDSTSIECGDVQTYYVDMDLSKEFKQDVLNEAGIKAAHAAGYTHFYAGRNCGLGKWDNNVHEYDVLIMMKRNKLLIRDYMGPMGIVGATVKVDVSVEALQTGVTLAGQKRALVSADGSAHGALSIARASGSDQVMVIVREQKKAPPAPAPEPRELTEREKIIEEARAAAREEYEELRREDERERFREWEKKHPLSALLCQGDHSCMKD